MSETNASVPPAVVKASLIAAVIIGIEAPLIAILTIVEPRLNTAVPVTTLNTPAPEIRAIIAIHSKGLGAVQAPPTCASKKLNSLSLSKKLLQLNY